MGIQQVGKAVESLVTQGVKKLKYVTPTCRVGTAKELGLELKTLNSDVVQIRQTGELFEEMSEKALKEYLFAAKYKHGDKLLPAYKSEEIIKIITAYKKNHKLVTKLLSMKISSPQHSLYNFPRFNSMMINHFVENAKNEYIAKFIIDLCENTSLQNLQMLTILTEAETGIIELGAKNVEMIAGIIKKAGINQWKGLSNLDFFKKLDAKTFNLQDFNLYLDKFDIKKLPANIQDKLKKMTENDFLNFLEFHYLNKTKNFSEDALTFKNLSQLISKKPISREALTRILSTHPCTDRNIGHFPLNWLDRISKNELECSEKFIQETISKFIKTGDTKIFEEELSKILNKSVKVTYLDKGAYGVVHKIQVDGAEDTIIKIFTDYNYYGTHGGWAEPQNAIFLSSNFDNFAHTYCARVASNTDKDSYYIAQYIGDNVKLIKPVNVTSKYKCTYIDDNGKNAINGINIDCGGCKIEEI